MIIGKHLLENAPERGALSDDFGRYGGGDDKSIQRRQTNP
jgi:hypothetical protein